MRFIRNLFKVARLLATDDSGDMRIGTISAMGKEQSVFLFTPYGVMSHPPNDSMVMLWNQQGHESNGIGIADDPTNRILKDLAEGEFAVGNYLTGDYVLFNENGDFIKVITGNSIQSASTFQWNGNTNNLTMWQDLNTQLQAFITAYNIHKHSGGGDPPTVSQTLDITGARADTLKTDG